jgi:hypothetical protein
MYAMLGKEGENLSKIATSIYQAETPSLLEAIFDPEEAEVPYQKTEQDIPIKNEDTVILQECILLYLKPIRHKLRTSRKLTPIDRANMAGMYLQCMYPANATEVTAMVHDGTDVEKNWIVEQPGGLKRWLINKSVVRVYSQSRIYRLRDNEPVSKNKI